MLKHIAIIADGNRRWAKSQGKPVALGHKAGAKALENIVRYANKIGLEYITVYAFSTENWKRSEEEVSALMSLLQNYITEYSKRADSENIKIKILGDINALSEGMQKSIKDCIERTKNNTGITFSIALNYGGRPEIIEAIKNISKDELNISADELMERFKRGDESRNTEGSGLGLAIAKEIILRHGGTIEIESPNQRGTIVKITLPLYNMDAEE